MSTIPRLLERHPHQVVMTVRSKPSVYRYRFGAANTLDTAFAGTTAMFDAPRGRSYRSLSIRKRRIGHVQESYRGLTKVHYDPQDFAGTGAIPGDASISFVRISEIDAAGTVEPEGPIMVVPPPAFEMTARPHLTVAGTAPSVTALASLLPPTGSMHFVLPRHADYVRIRNRGAVDLYVSFDPGQPEIVIPNGEVEPLYDAAISQVFVRGDGGTAAFDMYFALVNGAYD